MLDSGFTLKALFVIKVNFAKKEKMGLNESHPML